LADHDRSQSRGRPHPALALDAQVGLTLRTLGGLSTEEIARAFLVPFETMSKRQTRAKHKIRDAAIPTRAGISAKPRCACWHASCHQAASIQGLSARPAVLPQITHARHFGGRA
jgi:hypothetical protein